MISGIVKNNSPGHFHCCIMNEPPYLWLKLSHGSSHQSSTANGPCTGNPALQTTQLKGKIIPSSPKTVCSPYLEQQITRILCQTPSLPNTGANWYSPNCITFQIQTPATVKAKLLLRPLCPPIRKPRDIQTPYHI